MKWTDARKGDFRYQYGSYSNLPKTGMKTNIPNIGFEEEKMNAVINAVRKLKNDQAAYSMYVA